MTKIRQMKCLRIKVSSVVIIPEGFTRRFFEGYDTNIAVKTQATSNTKQALQKHNRWVLPSGFLYWAAASSRVEVLSEVPKEEGILGEKSEEFLGLNSLMFDMQQKTGEGILEFYEDIESNEKGRKSMKPFPECNTILLQCL